MVIPQETYSKELFPNGRWLLCCPDHYGIKYEINPWMNLQNTANSKLAWCQWKGLHHAILRLGGWVEYVEQFESSPDMVFTANGGLVSGNTALLAKFKYPERRGEEAGFRKWFIEHGFNVVELGTDGYFEGEGDALFAGETLFCGYGFRSDKVVYSKVAELLKIKKIILCELVDPYFYHLDTCFAPLNERQALIWPKAFSPESIKNIEKEIELIAVSEAEARLFCCNLVVLGKGVILPAGAELVAAELGRRGFEPHQVELSEFIKAGGAAKCLTLRLG
ncbi:MAG TPA: arginine deiminase-related protein [Oligoflexia bacterium]|nr:arginine deiminase-related protein [Oligoflexia bacterium]HMP26400.1 arginine deiminase-related protein [Oligoflexia bacterium]